MPRDNNEEADHLSNMDTTGFNPGRRVDVGPDTLSWKVLDNLMPAASEMFQRMLADRDPRPSHSGQPCHGDLGDALQSPLAGGVFWAEDI